MEEQTALTTIFHDFDFYGDLLTIARIDNKVYVAIRPVANFLGLDWASQYQRIQRDDVLAEEAKLIVVNGTDGRKRDMICLPIEFFHGWLFGIDTHRAKPELREKLTRYRRECFLVLSQAFQSRTVAPTETDVIPQLVADQAETHARVDNLEQDMKAVKVILSEIRGLSSAHRATAKEIGDQIHKLSGIPYAHIWGDFKKDFHVAAYGDVPDEKWPEVQKWLQKRLDLAKRGKGIEQQPSLFEDESEDK